MTSKNEIITLQFGHFSNHIGAHWWNIQDANFIFAAETPPEINYDALYREGETNKRVQTFTPRLLLVDLKGSLHNLPTSSALYDDVDDVNSESSDILWDTDKIQTVEEPEYEKNDFLKDIEKDDLRMECDSVRGAPPSVVERKEYNLNDSVKVWSDYCSTVFHPRSVKIINDYRHNDEQRRFNVFTQGTEVSKTAFFKDDWIDSCRLYVEECNNLQGFQVLFDCYDAYGGLTRAALEHLKDEYSSKTIVAYPAMCTNSSGTGIDDNAIRTVNTLFSVDSLIEFSSMFVPLAINYEGWTIPGTPRQFRDLKYDNNSPYHTAAILASYLDTITLRSRRCQLNTHLADLCHKLSPIGRICQAATLALPFHLDTKPSLMNILENMGERSMWTSLTPYTDWIDIDSSYLQDFVVRGLTEYHLYSAEDLKKKNMVDPVYHCRLPEELFSLYLAFSSTLGIPPDRCAIDSFDMPMKTNLSFPSIFSENGKNTQSIEKCPVVAGLHNSNLCHKTLSTLFEDAKKINMNHHPQFFNGGLERLDHGEALENLISLSENYL